MYSVLPEIVVLRQIVDEAPLKTLIGTGYVRKCRLLAITTSKPKRMTQP